MTPRVPLFGKDMPDLKMMQEMQRALDKDLARLGPDAARFLYSNFDQSTGDFILIAERPLAIDKVAIRIGQGPMLAMISQFTSVMAQAIVSGAFARAAAMQAKDGEKKTDEAAGG